MRRTRINPLRQPRRKIILSSRNLCAGFLGIISTLYLFAVAKHTNHATNANVFSELFLMQGSILPSETKITIAYAVILTSCKAGFTADGAAVLAHSIKLSSYPANKNSKYSYKMILFAHKDALECSKPFEQLGYEVQIKDTPIDVSKIKGDFYREHVVNSGCCGEKEFLKLYSYTLTDYPIVVQLDLDSLVLQPFDDLFDSMLNNNGDNDNGALRLPVMHNKSVPENIQAFYTKDYNMVYPEEHPHPGVQGGFLVIKPNNHYFEEYKRVILEGNFQVGGWGGEYGGYFGDKQIQGLCSYFFEALHPGTAVELNRCIYNSMNDAPKDMSSGDDPKLMCLDGKETCEDCRETDFNKVKSVHFTICRKPWICPSGSLEEPLCRKFLTSWYRIRKDFDEKNGVKTNIEGVDFHNDVFQGICSGQGEQNYKKLELQV